MRDPMNAIERFCRRHPRFGLPHLMKYIAIANAAFWLLGMVNTVLMSYLYFDPALILRGQVWRLITFALCPPSQSMLALIAIYFYYWIGTTLEQRWGTARFSLYYIGGAALTVIGAVLASLLSGNHALTVAGTYYVNMSLFLAFASLFPDVQLLVFFVIPVKMKWLAWIDLGLFGLNIVLSILGRNVIGVVLPIVALLNFAVFIWPEVKYQADRFQYRHSRQTVQFKKAVKQQQQQKGYHHKCCVCGKTDADYPDMTFRYCSKCAGYHCYCQDHIFSHVHFTEE